MRIKWNISGRFRTGYIFLDLLYSVISIDSRDFPLVSKVSYLMKNIDNFNVYSISLIKIIRVSCSQSRKKDKFLNFLRLNKRSQYRKVAPRLQLNTVRLTLAAFKIFIQFFVSLKNAICLRKIFFW